MATGSVEYAATIAGVRFAPIEVSNAHPVVEKIVLETQDGERLKITFHLTDIFALEDARTIVEGILPSLISRLAFHRNVPVGEPYFTGASLPKDASGSSHRVVADAILLWDSAMPVLTLGEDTRRELATFLGQPYKHHDLYSLYRSAISQRDPLARFMFLYNILLLLNDDRQARVEAFIREEMTDVEEYEDPRPNKAGKETIFTRLRNEVGHVREGTTPKQTRVLIENNVAALQTLVRTAISRVV
jgi:hypothetical protein